MATPMPPLVIAHRGFHLNGITENSVQAMRASNAVADGVEFDVRQTRDGTLVLNHDAVAFGLPIVQTDFRTLRAVSEKNGTPIPTLEEAVAEVDHGKFVVAEVKVGGIAERVVAACRPKFGEQFRIGSFNFSYISQIPRDLRWLIVVHDVQAWPHRHQLRGVDYRHGGELVRRWCLESSVWTVNDPGRVQRLVSTGVGYITTDNPGAIMERLRMT